MFRGKATKPSLNASEDCDQSQLQTGLGRLYSCYRVGKVQVGFIAGSAQLGS